MIVHGLIVLAATVWQSPASDSIQLLAERMPQAALVAELRARPMSVRDAVADALRRSTLAPAAQRAQAMSVAQALASAYAEAWRDSFLLWEVARFSRWSPAQRKTRLWSDSVRRAGIGIYGRDGPAAALPVWRRALHGASGMADTTVVAGLHGNIGAAHLALGRLDSADAQLRRAVALASSVGDLRVHANGVGALAGLSQDRGDLAAAYAGYTRALLVRQKIGDRRGIAADHNNLGLLAQESGQVTEARAHFEAALELNRQDGREAVAATNLVNLAGLASLEGEFATAEANYREALGIWRAGELYAEAASALHGLGQLEMRRGDYPAALVALREALEIYRGTGHVSERLAVQHAFAATLASAGDLQAAADQLQAAERFVDSVRAPAAARAGLALARADLSAQLNDHRAAERLYRAAAQLYRQASAPAGEAEAQQGLAQLLLERSDSSGAETLLKAALRTQRLAGHQRSAALTEIQLAKVAELRGDTAQARRRLAEAHSGLERVGDPVAAAAALAERARLEATAGRPAVAGSLYEAGLERLGDREVPEVAWRLRAGLGRTWLSRGSGDRAARELRAAVDELERPSRTLISAERRSGFLADKWSVYTDLARLEAGRGRSSAAFSLSERLRAREMLELLDRGRIASPGPVPADLAAREQDLRRRLAELSAQGTQPANSMLRGPDLPRSDDAAGESLTRAQQAYAELLAEIRERAPGYAPLVASQVADWTSVARRLGAKEALIEYLVSDSASLAFVVTRDTLATVDLGVSRRELTQLVAFVRGVLEPRTGTGVDALWRAPLRRLHSLLIAPVEGTGLLVGKQRLVLVPHADLHYLPFPAFLEDTPGDRFLIQRYELVETPSATVWLALGERTARRGTAPLLALAPRVDALPGSRREVAAISGGGETPRVLLGADATEAAFRREAPRRRELHLATYGVLNKRNPLFSYVELAPGDGHDGRLEVHEIFGLPLSADLVVLSACQTGIGSGALADVPAGDDWVGLTRAFLHAGAARVVATLWPVADAPTASLMERFYRQYSAGSDPVRALALAQRAALGAPATSHPFAWAGFIIVGGAPGAPS